MRTHSVKQHDSGDKAAAATTGGAIGISAFVSFIGLCCIGPWAVMLCGVAAHDERTPNKGLTEYRSGHSDEVHGACEPSYSRLRCFRSGVRHL